MQGKALTLYSFTVAIVIAIIIFGIRFSWAPSFNKINGVGAGGPSWFRAHDWRNTSQDGLKLVNLLATPTQSVQGRTVMRSGFGYLLTLKYTDQLTAAPPNIASLMCVAGEWGSLRVVEPFLVQARFGLNANKEELKFSDVYNPIWWEHYVTSKNYTTSGLVPYETFIKDAPPKVILVQYFHPCGDKRILEMTSEFCKSNRFELVRKVCLTYENKKMLTLAELKGKIYSHFKPTEVTVLFELYGGLINEEYTEQERFRIFVNNEKCARHYIYDGPEPSEQAYSDANVYIQNYLKGNTSYISLMVRIEYLMIHNKCYSRECVRRCLNTVVNKWREVKQRTGLTTTFLAIDVGKYGSDGFQNSVRKNATKEPVEEFFSIIFNNRTSPEEWEESFSTVGFGRKKTAGYIGLMQKIIATKGEVLIQAGNKAGSTYQMIALVMFRKTHGKDRVYEINPECPSNIM